MNRDQKAAVVEEIAEQIQAAQAIFAVDYRGLSVSQAADLRSRLRESDTKFRIVKNSLSELAADKAGAENLKPLLQGPTALALVQGDAALAAKALNDTARALNNILEFKGGVMNGTTLSGDDVRSIARLPSRDVLNAQLVGTIAAPLTGLVRGLNALIAGIAIQLKAIADQGLVSGEAPSPAADPRPDDADEAAAAPSASSADGEDAPPDTSEAAAESAEEAVSASEEPEAASAAEEPEPASHDEKPEAAGEPGPEAAEKTSEDSAEATEPDGEVSSPSEDLAPEGAQPSNESEAQGPSDGEDTEATRKEQE